MLIAFRPSADVSGIRGMSEAIVAAATAAAGSTPAKPTYCDVWRVISNEEAGGWTVEVSSGTTSTTATVGEKVRLSAPTKKVNGDVAKKYFALRVNNSTTSNYNWWNFFVKFPERTNRGDNPSYESTERYLTDYDNTSSSTVSFQAWYGNRDPNEGEWMISITENYCYIFRPAGNGVDIVTYKSELCGCADLTGTPDNLLGSSHAYDPFVGFFHGYNTNDPADQNDGDNLFDYIQFSFGGAGNRNYISGNSNYKWVEYRGQAYLSMSAAASNPTSEPVIRFAPHYQGDIRSDDNTYGKTVTASGSKIYSMHPAVVYQPFKGVPYQTIDGLKYLGNFSDTEFSSNMKNISNELNFKYFYDENGDRYIANPSMGIVRLIRAM